MKISDEEKLENAAKIFLLISTFEEDRKNKLTKFLESDYGQNYFVAPASSRVDYHSAFPGGLAYHSLKVVRNLLKMSEDMYPGKFSKQTLAFVGLFHDFGKLGDGEQLRYEPNPSKNHLFLYPYVVNKKMNYLTTSDGSLYLLQKIGIQLTFEEFQAIKLNDGQYDPANAGYKMRECELSLLLHWADLKATVEEKNEFDSLDNS